ncbi:MAG: hypothetical protein AAGC72_17485, partial [Planctomycetota bacterium]
MMVIKASILVLEDAQARIDRFKNTIASQLPHAQLFITKTADDMIRLIDDRLLEQLAHFPARCHTAVFPARRLRYGVLDGLTFEGVGGIGPGRVPGIG